MPNRQNNVRVSAVLDNVSLGVFEERMGGDADSAAVSYSMGGMGPRVALGGRQELANVIIRRLFDDAARGQAKWAASRRGRGVMAVTEQPLDDEGAATGEPFVWTGVLKRANLPDRNSDSDAAGVWELEMVATLLA